MFYVRSPTIAATVAVMASLLVAHGVAAAQEDDGVRERFRDAPVTIECPATPPVFCLGPSPGNEAAVQVRIAKSALPIERMCFTIRFEGDLLDAGESVSIGFSPDPFALGFGFENIGTEPISERTACIVAGLHDDLLAMVAVKKPMVFVYVNHGSATVADLEVFLLPL
jgi:hypothetical protein